MFAADSFYIFESTVFHYFKSLKDPSRPLGLHFQIKKIINELNCCEQISAQKAQKCSIIFLDNATCYSESLYTTYKQVLQITKNYKFRTASSWCEDPQQL